jgi:hypothetical protein
VDTAGIEPASAIRDKGRRRVRRARRWLSGSRTSQHSPALDFEATAAGAEWIDAIAAKAKSLAAEPGELVIGHHD